MMALSHMTLKDHASLIEYGVESTNHVLAVKKTMIPAGVELTQHVHDYAHDSLLVTGIVKVYTGSKSNIYEAPVLIRIPEGIQHKILAISDAEWWCMHEIDDNGDVVL
jgi:quercetin dioxygenase-like cupin family protein